MRSVTKMLLMFNGLTLLIIVLWLLVGGQRRGYFGGGAAGEVDGILVLFLGAFNVAYLLTVLLVLSSHAAQRPQAEGGDALWSDDVLRRRQGTRSFVYNWSLYALSGNGLVILFIGLWLLLNDSGRWNYVRGNATEVDLILLFVLSLCNILYMGLALFHFSGAETMPRPAAAPGK